MNVKPIPFSPPMVRALLEGRKTQTRRVLKPQPQWLSGDWYWRSPRYDNGAGCDYFHTPNVSGIMSAWVEAMPYAPGDLLWVREEHRAETVQEGRRVDLSFDADGAIIHCAWPERCVLPTPEARRAPMHLPREASRLTLRVTEVRVQRLQEISAADAQAEGAAPECDHCGRLEPCGCELPNPSHGRGFMRLWDSLNAQRGFGWDANPWVAAYSFELIKDNVDAVLADRLKAINDSSEAPYA